MPYGMLTDEMRAAISPHVAGRVVWDLGSGGMTRAVELQELGACVIAVDKEPWVPPPRFEGRFVQAYFHEVEVPAEVEVAFLAWPQNSALAGLIEILARSRMVVYLGSNTDHNACGNPSLFTYLSSREVLAHIPHPRNSLIVYGGEAPEPRAPLPEEWAALHPETMFTIEEAVEAVRGR